MRNLVTCGLAALVLGVAAQAALAAGASPTTALSNQPGASSAAAQPDALRGTSGFAVSSGEQGKTMGLGSGANGAALLKTQPATKTSASAQHHQTLQLK